MSTGSTSHPSTPPPPPTQDSLSFPEAFAGSATAFDEIPGHASTQQAPPTPAATRRASTQLGKLAITPVDSSSSPSPSPATTTTNNASLLSPHSATSVRATGGTRSRQRESSSARESVSGTSSVGNATTSGGYRSQSASDGKRRLVLERYSLYETKTVRNPSFFVVSQTST